MSRGFKNFLGIVLACIALSALFSSPVGFFDVVVAVMCIIAAILLLKPTESEKQKRKRSSQATNLNLCQQQIQPTPQ